ncbi:MAG: type IV pilus assembly protein PilM [Phycisphaeraceae bacterium]|nr:type IV pilus assembly protein PilM [Phycisphaeraceae bacterium]
MAKNDAWGIEVGADAIKAIRLARSGDDVTVLEYDVLPFKQILTTPDINAKEEIQVNLDQFLQRHDLRKSAVWVSVPGHMGFARFAKLPPVEPKKIPDIVKFEAVQQIPFPIEQVEWDYQTFQQDDSPDVEVGIFAIGKDRVNAFLDNYRSVGMNIDGLTLSPVAVFNALTFDMNLSESGEGVAFVDIGSSSTDVVVSYRGNIWVRTLQIGGNDFTEALVKAFKLSFPKAEKLKREAATSKYARQIFQAMRPVFADLVQELQRSLGYFQSLNRDATLTKIIGVGSTFRLPGLQKFLKQQLQMDVVRLTEFKRLAVEGKDAAEFADHALNLATSYGLALQGLGLETVSANIIPSQVVQQRMWKAKQPWFAAAAAVLLVALGWNFLSLVGAKGQYDPAELSSVRGIVSKASALQQRWEELSQTADPREEIERIRRIPESRTVWPLILTDIQLALKSAEPQPPLLGTDYDQVAAIPRQERRRIIVESISAQYRVGPGDPVTAGSNNQDPWRIDPWAAAGGEGAGLLPPSFVIRIKGTTPNREGVTFFTETFIRWLRENGDRADRPYKLVLHGNPLLEFDRVGGEGPAGSSGAAGMPPGLPGTALPPREGGQRALTDLSSFFPTRPLANEPRHNDWRFELQFTIEVRKPEEARTAEERLYAAGPDAAVGPAPAAPVETPAQDESDAPAEEKNPS